MNEPYRTPDVPPPEPIDPNSPVERARRIKELSDSSMSHARKAVIWAWVSLAFALLSVAIQVYLYWYRHHLPV